MKLNLRILLLGLVMIQSCNYLKAKKKRVERDTSISTITSFNTLFFDSMHLDTFLDQNIKYGRFNEQFKDFYSDRNYQYAWFDSSGLTEQAYNFLNLQEGYVNDFNDSILINQELKDLVEIITNKKTKINTSNPIRLQTEFLLTGQFFQYAEKVYKGSDLNAKELGWFIPRKKINLHALLDSTIKSKQKGAEQFTPLNLQYKKLEVQLILYMGLEKKESVDTIPSIIKSIKIHDINNNIIFIKKRLQLLGDLKSADTSASFDSTLLLAVTSFQKRMGLSVDGVIGNKMIVELNIPLSKRIRQLLINMERVRWMPIEKDSNYILVNIPEYKMHVYDSGNQVFDINVIVGTEANSTVIFTGKLKYVVFSPYWNLPESIVKNEVMVGMRKNGNYLRKNNMEITGYNGKTPIIRQKPGAKNSLGLVKFLFPNSYSIYFHDTPNRELFSLSKRSFSHGCIRLEEPKKFAEYLLRFEPFWNSNAIDSVMHLAKEKWVAIKQPLPVFIGYFTAWVDKGGLLNFRKDIYGHDEKMGEKLFAK